MSELCPGNRVMSRNGAADAALSPRPRSLPASPAPLFLAYVFSLSTTTTTLSLFPSSWGTSGNDDALFFVSAFPSCYSSLIPRFRFPFLLTIFSAIVDHIVRRYLHLLPALFFLLFFSRAWWHACNSFSLCESSMWMPCLTGCGPCYPRLCDACWCLLLLPSPFLFLPSAFWCAFVCVFGSWVRRYTKHRGSGNRN